MEIFVGAVGVRLPAVVDASHQNPEQNNHKDYNNDGGGPAAIVFACGGNRGYFRVVVSPIRSSGVDVVAVCAPLVVVASIATVVVAGYVCVVGAVCCCRLVVVVAVAVIAAGRVGGVRVTIIVNVEVLQDVALPVRHTLVEILCIIIAVDHVLFKLVQILVAIKRVELIVDTVVEVVRVWVYDAAICARPCVVTRVFAIPPVFKVAKVSDRDAGDVACELVLIQVNGLKSMEYMECGLNFFKLL